MRQDKQLAVQLRISGNSYGEISKKLNIAKSTLSFWLKDLKISAKAQDRINNRGKKISTRALINRNKRQTEVAHSRSLTIREENARLIGSLTARELLLVGTALYWGEGYKKGAEGSNWKCVDFTNSDPTMIKMIMRFFRETCWVKNESFKIQIMLHNNIFKKEALKFWSKVTKVPKKQFIKISIIKSKASKEKQKNVLKYGTVHIRVYNTDLFHKIIGYIDGIKNKC
jgi:hypothetical protein